MSGSNEAWTEEADALGQIEPTLRRSDAANFSTLHADWPLGRAEGCIVRAGADG